MFSGINDRNIPARNAARWLCSAHLLGAGVACLTLLLALPEPSAGRSLARRPGRDLLQAPLINTDSVGGSAEWDNREVRGQVRQRGCELSVDIRRAHQIAGRDLVCLWGSDSVNDVARGGVSQVIAGRVDSRGRVKLRLDGRDDAGCDSLGDVIVYHAQMDCYLASVGTQAGDYDWQTACEDAGGLVLPPALADAPTGGGLVGGCFVAEGDRIPPPGAPRLATSGAFTRVD